jgi:hypothetical protein
MYRGALQAAADLGNPDRFAQAAHSLRELMEKLPRDLDTPEETGIPTLTDKVRQLQRGWAGVMNHASWPGNPPWQGEINDPMKAFLRKTEEFFDWLETDRQTRNQQAARVLRGMDPMGMELPEPIERLRIREWRLCHEYFENISHHRQQVAADEFQSWLQALERFLLDRLRPRTFEDHAELDRIIAEGEGHARP